MAGDGRRPKTFTMPDTQAPPSAFPKADTTSQVLVSVLIDEIPPIV
jgi:hypothetical protein